ncbi:MAG: hypothetical protein KatS3mg068_2089 [Candidatus Sericytochromatia bacterium]|nr:MAG: hypothetical protein KatS3mg068_2089 [Candidatus Sericytochromatia bacterium]
MNVSRRFLFTNWINTFSENVEEIVKNIPLIGCLKENSNKLYNQKKFFKVGLLNDFPPQSITTIKINDKDYMIFSNEIGLYCVEKCSFENNKIEPRLFIKIDSNGEVLLNPYEFLPEGKILSIITNEFIDEKEV